MKQAYTFGTYLDALKAFGMFNDGQKTQALIAFSKLKYEFVTDRFVDAVASVIEMWNDEGRP